MLTNIEDISAPTCIEMERRIASRTILRLELPDKLVEASLVRDVCARKLKNPLSSQSVFQRLLAHGTLAPNKCALPPRSGPVGIHDA